eukprot:4195626-Pyramimonas_sp.AAC.1
MCAPPHRRRAAGAAAARPEPAGARLPRLGTGEASQGPWPRAPPRGPAVEPGGGAPSRGGGQPPPRGRPCQPIAHDPRGGPAEVDRHLRPDRGPGPRR